MTSSSPAHALGESPGDIPRGQLDSSSHEISAEMVGKSSMAQELSQESSMILDASLSSEEHIEGDVKGPVPLPSTTTTTTASGSDEATTTATTSASSETTGSVSVTTSQPSRPAQIRASDSQGSSSPSINNLVPQASSSISQSVSTDGREPQVANEKKTTPFVDPATSSTTTSLSSTSSSSSSSSSSSDRPLSQASSSSNKKQINTTTTTTSLHMPFTNSTSGTSATRTTTTTTTTTTAQHTFPSTLPPSAALLAPTPSVPTVRRWFSDIIDVMAERCVPVAAAGANGEPLALHPGKPWIENASVLLTSLPCPEAATFQRMICSPLTDLEYEKELLGASARPLHRQGNIYAGLLYVTDANIPRNAFDGFSRHKPTATSTQASFRGSSALSVRGRITTILVEHKIYSQASGQHWSTCRLTRLVLKATIQPSSKGNGLAKQRTLFHYYLSCGKHQPVSLLETLKAHKATHGIPLRNYNRPSQTEDIEAALQLTALCSPNVTLVARPLSSSSSSTSSVPAAPSAPSSAQFAPSTTTTTESALRPASSTASSLPTTTGSSSPPPPSASPVSPALSPSSSDSIAISAPPHASVNATMSDAPSAQEDSVPAVTPTSSVSPKSSSILASSSPSSSDATPPQPPPKASNDKVASTLPATAFNAPSPSYSVSPPSSSSSALSSSSPPVSATAVVPASPAPKRTASQANCVASPIVTKAANTSIPPSEPSSFIQPAQIEGNLLLSLGRRSPSSVTTTHQHQV